MGDVQFDAADASALARVARRTAGTLRGQAGPRSGAVASALDDFEGAYADRFRDAAVVEAEDRARLAGVLVDLADQIDAAVAAAERERERQRDHADWKARDADRKRAASVAEAFAGSAGRSVVDALERFTDPEPATEPEPRPEVDAEFRGRERARYGDGASRGRSSADPGALRAFLTTTSGLDTTASAESERVRSAWSSFRSSCAWVTVDRASMPAGFARYVRENDEDRRWIGRIADAFEAAGGSGSLSNAALDIAATGQAAPALQRLFAEHLTPTEVAERWAALGLTTADASVFDGFPTDVLARLGNLEGVPYWARSTANALVLNQRLVDVERQIEQLERTVASAGDGSRVLARELTALYADRKALRNVNAALTKKGSDGKRFLIALTDDRPPLAAVSIGDLDRADSVTWAVPGMNTTSADMTMWSRGAQNIYQEQARRPGSPSHAVVACIGYATPDEKDVLFMGKAKKGGGQLADALRGLDAVRAGQVPETNVVAHSYGTTTAAVALAEQGVHVDRFVALGSAGLPDHLRSITDIHADHVYAARAKDAPTGKEGLGDEWAEFGREQSYAHHVDPTRDIFGVNVFGVDGATAADGTDLAPVLHHDPLRSDLRGYLDRGTESLRNVGLATTARDAELTPASSG
ncbi:alpha/beta hydrolase [Curtobacterium caseinilyticum]|uniref:Alpha/beta hydrolase n=1 Tax=Curtobacterium caseinilyticum TaxID=3055137 RepID=A0ABT7TUX3_9MICO|nr:alpha/beta hydrolase [Curtobacterium caseinilyticum]MDM7892697.1 alpha/beta hydrolase [Curtobacterium caseinilyticum]